MSQKFKNILTQRFHDYFYQKLKEGEIDADKFWEDFSVVGVNKPQFFSGMRSGHRGITPDQVMIAWEKYRVRPDYLFGVSDDLENEPISIAAESETKYAKSISTDISKIRKLLDDLEKKIENK